MGDVTQTNIAVVRKLCDRWPWMTADEFAECLTADCVYINVPRPSVRRIGPVEAHKALKDWQERAKIELTVMHIVGDENVVLTERLERFEKLGGNGPVIDLYVMGVFEMKDGKIAQWRDYFESSQSASGSF